MGAYAGWQPRPAGTTGHSLPARLTSVALAVVAVSAALVSGVAATDGNRLLVILPLAAVVGIALAVLACTRYAAFVLLLLGARSSMDALQVTTSTPGQPSGASLVSHGADLSSILGVLFLAASMLWLAGRYFSGTYVKASRLTVWLVAFFAAGALSITGSTNIEAGILQGLRIMTAVMMFVVLEQLITDLHRLKAVLVACYASLVVPLAYTLVGLAIGNPASEVKSGFTRLLGTFTQSNDYGRYLAFMLVFGVAVYPHVKGRLRIALTVVLALCATFLVFTLTLGAIGAAALGVLLLAIVQRRKALVVSLLAAAVIALVAAPGLTARVTDSSTQSQIGGDPTGNSLAWRFSYWADILPLANSNPITGIGLNSTQYMTSSAKQPHNDFLRAYVETGVVGLVTYLGMLVALVGTAWHALRRHVRGTFSHAVSAGALACAVCFVLESLAANVITNVANLWYLLAFAAAASYLARVAVVDRRPVPVEQG